jgi:hypothetical protein
MTATLIVASGAMGASAQQNPATPQPPFQAQQQPSGGMMAPGMGRGSMMGEGMMGRGMMGRGMTGGMMGPGMMSPIFMRMMFALMDADGDGTVSLQEFQDAHARIFKAMDANKDGVLSLEEIQGFMRGPTPAAQPSGAPTPPR